MKKKQLANLIMVLIIGVILTSGILGVGYIRGWFDADAGESALLTDIWGIINLERDGVSFPVEDETVLRNGDRIRCGPGATAVIQLGDGYPDMGENAKLTMGEHAELVISDPSVSTFSAVVSTGELFVDTTPALTLSFDGNDIVFDDTVASVSVRSGAQSISVFAGTVEEASSGQIIDWVGDSCSVSELKITSLNDFTIGQIRKANEHKFLCFSDSQLDALIAAREAEMQAQLNQTDPPETVPEETTAPTETVAETEPPKETEAPKPKPTEPAQTEPPQTEPPQTEPPQTEPAETEPAATEIPETVPATEPPATQAPLTCTISIRCDTILNNMENLDPAKAAYVPSGGVILSTKTVEFTEGETVFDVLKRVCDTYGIQLEYSWTPMYDSYYIEGIHNLYEFDCGPESGWMYKVNGWFPNYGCSSYTLAAGDSIVWCYTCSGLGADVGA